MGFIKKFTNFAFNGNIVELAIAVIFSVAMVKLITSLVNYLIIPSNYVLTGGIDFKELQLVIMEVIGTNPAIAWNYGMFIQNAINFVFVAFSIIIILKIYYPVQSTKVVVTSLPATSRQELRQIEQKRFLVKFAT